MISKPQLDALCYGIEAHSPMVMNMTPDERAELFKAIQEAIPIMELFAIVESAERSELHNYCDGMLMPRIRTLKAKLKERGIEL